MSSKKEHKKALKEQALTLKIGDWKKQFTAYEYKMMICRALNECVEHHQFKIKGYLITEDNAFLLWKVKEEKQALFQLEEHLEKIVKQSLRWLRKLQNKDGWKEHRQLIFQDHQHWFEVYPLINQNLVDVLKKGSFEKSYYDPQLEKIIDRSENDLFSSVGRYGKKETGPVIINEHYFKHRKHEKF